MDKNEKECTRDQTKDIQKGLLPKEADIHGKPPPAGVFPQMFYMIEKTKIYDQLYLDTGIKIHQHFYLVQKHKIMQDQDMIELEARLEEESFEKMTAMFDDLPMSDKFDEHI
jgi:hypothetical protein